MCSCDECSGFLQTVRSSDIGACCQPLHTRLIKLSPAGTQMRLTPTHGASPGPPGSDSGEPGLASPARAPGRGGEPLTEACLSAWRDQPRRIAGASRETHRSKPAFPQGSWALKTCYHASHCSWAVRVHQGRLLLSPPFLWLPRDVRHRLEMFFVVTAREGLGAASGFEWVEVGVARRTLPRMSVVSGS